MPLVRDSPVAGTPNGASIYSATAPTRSATRWPAASAGTAPITGEPGVVRRPIRPTRRARPTGSTRRDSALVVIVWPGVRGRRSQKLQPRSGYLDAELSRATLRIRGQRYDQRKLHLDRTTTPIPIPARLPAHGGGPSSQGLMAKSLSAGTWPGH